MSNIAHFVNNQILLLILVPIETAVYDKVTYKLTNESELRHYNKVLDSIDTHFLKLAF